MIDHLVYATTDLDASVRDIGEQLGVTPEPGGQHVGHGTRNYLLGLGGSSYLELIGPDPEQPDFAGIRTMGLDTLLRPQLSAWAVRVTDIETAVETARAQGYDPGPVRSMSRRQPNDQLLSWRLTDIPGDTAPILLPFLIDWGDSPHPSQTAPVGAQLVSFSVESPDAKTVRAALVTLGVHVAVAEAEYPRLTALIQGPRGTLRLD
ncbi:MAG TPA: VOC family protein [Chloroflexota bacterium]